MWSRIKMSDICTDPPLVISLKGISKHVSVNVRADGTERGKAISFSLGRKCVKA